VDITLERDGRAPDRLAPTHDASAGATGLRGAIAAYARVAAAVEDSSDVDALLEVVARQIGELVGVERCSIHLRDESAGVFRGCVGHAGSEALGADIKRSLAGVPADGITAELLRTQRPVIVGDAQRDPRTVKSTVRFWKIRSIMAVPMVFKGEVIGVVFLDDVDRPHEFSAEHADVATAFAELAAVAVMDGQSRANMRAQLDAQQRQIKALRRATAVDERLSDLVLEGQSLPELLGTLSELLGKPCAVYGADGDRLATAVPPGADDGIAPKLLEPPHVDRPEVREALAAHAGSRAFVVGPLPAAGVLHRYVVAPVLVGAQTWGHLVVMEHKRRFSGGDLLTLRRAATLVALQVTTERRAIEADWNAGASLAAELLGGCSDVALAQRRADRLGVRLDIPRVVTLICARDNRDRRILDFRAVVRAFADAAPDLTVQAIATSAGVAALVGMPEGADEHAFVARAKHLLHDICETLCPEGLLIAGVSGVRSNPVEYRAAYVDVQQVVACIRRFAPRPGAAVFSAEDLGAGRVFLATSDRELVVSHAEATLGVLVGDPAKADLLATLCSFFDNKASTRRVAERLGVHENTIRYRLSRVEQLTGLAVTHDPDAQLQAHMALLVLELQGRVPDAALAESMAALPSLAVVRDTAL
jgi:GAF domain-containing protein